MKTAMQELIDDLKELKKDSKERNKDTSFDIGMTFAIARAELRLKKEKEQIIEAYEDGKQNGMDSITNIHMYIIGEKYYNQTYNQKSIDAAELLYNIVKKEVDELNKDRYE